MIVARVGGAAALLLLAAGIVKAWRLYGGPGWSRGEFELFVTFLLAMAVFVLAAVAGNIGGDYAVAVRRGLNAGDGILRQASVLGTVATVVVAVVTLLWIVRR